MESLVTMALFLAIILITGSLYSLAQSYYNRAESELELIQNARVSFDRMSREIRQSIDIASPLSADQSQGSGEIVFQNGHDSDTINYIYYYLDGSNLRRANLVYYFPEEPDIYVKYNSVNQAGEPPEQEVLEDRKVGEYFHSVNFWGDDGLVNISSELMKEDSSFFLRTSVFSRNY